jgi:hypothetical protein
MASNTNEPILSIVVIVYNMAQQAMNTLYSLSANYQSNTDQSQYEVIVMENASSQCLEEEDVLALGNNFSYHLRQEPLPTPIYAVNEGVALARAKNVCLMIDGARMVTPGIVHHTLTAFKINPDALIATPGYHIGEQDQRYNKAAGHNENSERQLLLQARWKDNGYRLFDIGCVSMANQFGCFHPLMESNCFSFPKTAFEKTGGAHEGFQSPGGGSVNLDIYRNILLLPETKLFILAGEGSFHQYHGGVTTSEVKELEAVWASHREEFKSIRGEYYSAALREPTIFGHIGSYALPHFLESSKFGQRRFNRFKNQNMAPWKDDLQ